MLGGGGGGGQLYAGIQLLRDVDRGLLARSLDLLDVDFLSVNAVIGVASHAALSVTGKGESPRSLLMKNRRFAIFVVVP